MITREFLESSAFTAITYVLSGNEDIVVDLPNAQIVKIDCANCIPGLQLDCGSLGLFMVGSTGNYSIEQPIDIDEDQTIGYFKILGISATFPNESIYGTVTVYYWYPSEVSVDTSYSYLELATITGPICYKIVDKNFETISLYATNYLEYIQPDNFIYLIKANLNKYTGTSFLTTQKYYTLENDNYIPVPRGERFNSEKEYYYYTPTSTNTEEINLLLATSDIASYLKTDLDNAGIKFLELGSQISADIVFKYEEVSGN